MKIYFDTRWVGSGGIGRFAEEIFQRSPIELEKIELKGSPLSFLSPIKIDILLALNRDAIYFSPGFNAPFFFAKRSIITIHDLIHVNYKEYHSISKKLYYNIIVKRACKKSIAIFTDSNYSKEEIYKWANISKEKIIVVGCGVGENFYMQNIELRNKRPTEHPYIIYVGNHKSHKNLKRLIIAFSQAKIPKETRLVFSGKKNNKLEHISKECNIDKRLIFTGAINDETLYSYYHNSIFCAQVSLYEGFGLPVIEAMASGTLVVNSNTTSLKEISGKATIQVDPYSIESIKTGIEKGCNEKNTRIKKIKLGFEQCQKFTWENVVKKITKTLYELET